MTGGLSQSARVLAAVEREMPAFPPVPQPVQISDETHPEIALAIAHARKLRGEP